MACSAKLSPNAAAKKRSQIHQCEYGFCTCPKTHCNTGTTPRARAWWTSRQTSLFCYQLAQLLSYYLSIARTYKTSFAKQEARDLAKEGPREATIIVQR